MASDLLKEVVEAEVVNTAPPTQKMLKAVAQELTKENGKGKPRKRDTIRNALGRYSMSD